METKKWGRVHENIVVEISLRDPEEVGLPVEIFVPLPDEAKTGYAFFDSVVYPCPAHGDRFDESIPGWSLVENALEMIKAEKIASIDTRTMELITAGFDYEVDGEVYYFGYDETDQNNFTAAAVAANLALTLKQNFSQTWRGWQGDTPYTLSFDTQGFVALASHAGMVHKQGLLSSGWDLTNRVRAAESIEEVELILDERK